jgi:hypothetical protein
MRRRVAVGLVVWSALCAALVASAQASPPEFGRCVKKAGGHWANAACTQVQAGKEAYEWESGVVENGFHAVLKEGSIGCVTGSGHVAQPLCFETVRGTLTNCRGATETGRITGPSSVGAVVITFTECESGSLRCASPGAASGTIVTDPLEGTLGISKVGETAAKDQLAIELHGAGGGAWAEYECGGLPFRVRGAVLAPLPANRMMSGTVVKYAQAKGEQKPSAFAGEGEDARTLETSIGGFEEETGLGASLSTTFEERVEANSVV